MKYMYVLFLVLFVFFLSGCETPEGGSSLPWSKPEPWEGQVLPIPGE